MKKTTIITVLLLTIISPLIISSSALNLPHSVEVSLADADLIYYGEQGGDWAAYSLSPAGDVNGDGFDDIIIGAPMAGERNNPNVEHGAGKAYLLLGRPDQTLPPSPINLAEADASFLGCRTPSMTARQLYTAGDVNGDGYDDFLICGWKCGDMRHGKAYLFLGKPRINWGSDFPVEKANASFLGEFDLDYASYYVSTAGDVNGDGLDDFLITATKSDANGEDSGKIYLILGRANADWGRDFPLKQADAAFLGENPFDNAGRSATSAGDVNNDGLDDIILGAMGNDEGGDRAGQVYLILGRLDADWGSKYSLVDADASFIGEAAGDEAGRRVSTAGDVNGDGFSDFLIGSPTNDQGGEDAGKAYLLLGRETPNWGMDYPLAEADAAFIGEASLDLAGRRVSSAGDVNNDGFSDFLIGAPHNTRGGIKAGAAYLLHGHNDANWGNAFPLADADLIYIGKPDGAMAGYDIAPAGDFNGDSIDDFLIGAFGGRFSVDYPGEAYVILSDDTPVPLKFSPDEPQGNVNEWLNYKGIYQDLNGAQDIDRAQIVIGKHSADDKGLNSIYVPSEDAYEPSK